MPSNAYQLGLMVNTGRHLCMSTAYQKLTASWCRIRLQCKTQKTMKKWKRYLRNFVKSPCYPYCPAHEPRHEDATKSLLLAALASPSTLGDCSTVPPILKLKRKACPICWFSERFWTISSARPRKRRGQSTPQTPAAVWETCQDRSCQFGTSSLEWYGWWPHGALRVQAWDHFGWSTNVHCGIFEVSLMQQLSRCVESNQTSQSIMSSDVMSSHVKSYHVAHASKTERTQMTYKYTHDTQDEDLELQRMQNKSKQHFKKWKSMKIDIWWYL